MPNIQIKQIKSSAFEKNFSVKYYCILLFDGLMKFSVDFTDYESDGKTTICLSPFQQLQICHTGDFNIQLLQFHGDFYCIEYHKQEVACNGLLFNAIYLRPYFKLSISRFQEIQMFFHKMVQELEQVRKFDEAIIKSYLQLILALCSAEKSKIIKQPIIHSRQKIAHFQVLLELHFRTERSPVFYADIMAMSLPNFSKKVKSYFGKTPSLLIQERVNLEAKRLLHLTHKSIKEIANELDFEDEFYFSRYFKKSIGISPSHFREQTGVSIIAK